MELKFALLCDYAAQLAGGKLLIAGEFDHIFATKLPAVHGPFYMIGRIEAQVSEGTNHKLRIGLYDADGQPIGNATPDIPFQFNTSGPGRPLRGQFIAQLRMTFPKHGSYQFHILVNGRIEGTVPVDIIRPPSIDVKT